MFFRDQFVCCADFVGMTLLKVFFLLPLPKCFVNVCLPILFAAVLKFLDHYQHLQFLAQQNPTSQPPPNLQPRRYIYRGMELRFSQ